MMYNGGMALFMNRQDQRSDLQKRIVQNLNEKAKNSNGPGAGEAPKNEPLSVEDLKYLENTKQTTTLAWAWLLIFIFAAVIVLMFVIQ